MKPFIVRFWRGTPIEKIIKSCRKGIANDLFFDGTITEFMVVWNDKFLFYPPSESQIEYISGVIFVTPQYDGFGQK